MAVTIREVAEQAGVSIATVSRVFNEKGLVSADTRERILEVAARLNYVPHAGARSLVSSRTTTIAVLLPEIYGEFFSELIRGIDRAARERGYQLLVSSSHSDRADLDAAVRATWGRVDGLIVMEPDLLADGPALHRTGPVPLVVLNAPASAARPAGAAPVLTIDNYGGAVAMVKHLHALGHRRIAFVGGPAGNNDATERLKGWRDAMRELGLAAARELEVAGDFREESGWRAGRAILDLPRRPDAVFAANDAMAIGILSALRDAGVTVPDGMALAGFDDIPIARFTAPPLTTVRVPILELGERAALRLIDSIERPAARRAPRNETLPTELVVRASCGAGRGGHGPAARPRAKKRGPALTT